MIRRVITTGLLLAASLLSAASSAVAVDEILKMVPESAMGVLIVNRPATLDVKLQTLAQEMQLPPFSPLALLKQQLKIQAGVKETGTLGLILLPSEDDDSVPTPILLIPVTDYNKFIEPFEPENAADAVTKIKLFPDETWVRNIGNYAAVTNGEHREILENALKLGKDIPPGLVPWRDWLAGRDVAGVVLSPGVKQLSAKAREGIDAAKSTLAEGNEQMQKAAVGFDLYARLFQAAETEVDSFGIGVQIDKQNTLRLTKRVALVPGSKWAQCAAQVHAAKDPLLAGLPDEPFVVAGGAALSDPLLGNLMTFSLKIMEAMPGVYGLSEEQMGKLSETMSEAKFHGLRSMSLLVGVGEGNEPVHARTVGVMQVENAQAFLTAYEQFADKYGKLLKEINSPMLGSFDIEKSEIGGVAGLQITVQMPQPPDAEQAPPFNAIIETMVGPGGKLVCWVMPADEHHIVLGYIDQERVAQTIEAVKQGKAGLDANADVAKTTALLPPDTAMAGYLSVPGTVNFTKRIVATIVPQAGLSEKIPDFPETPPIGFALTAGANEVQTSLIVPIEVLKAAVPYAHKVQQAVQGNAPAEVP